ncbi:hypothetical protein SeMB42_g04606 [Synchytrium endobioticum]|uniref:Uncharacterized protein n=1 Tax=Synchytrium endobioticum TaxID=286115 RepID=A0A507CX23_9FUNG|nr:hypothetical protein SeMB42_g04606 [Synchytrium endobioticum]
MNQDGCGVPTYACGALTHRFSSHPKRPTINTFSFNLKDNLIGHLQPLYPRSSQGGTELLTRLTSWPLVHPL